MKNIVTALLLFVAIASIPSCKKDEGKLPDIKFKIASGYTFSDEVKSPGSTITIGIIAAKTEKEDVLKNFNISQSVNGGSPFTVFNKVLTGSEGDNYAYDFTTTLDTVVGQTDKFTFTVSNRDGLVNQVALTTTIQ